MLSPVYEDFQVDPWPSVVRLKEDELLSSWMVRLAFSHLQKVHTFYNLTFRGMQIWNRDIDKCASDHLVAKLAKLTLTHEDRIWESSLKNFEGSLFEKLITNGNTEWIMPCKVYHRKHERFALMYCPKCFEKDKREPYYRKKWRLSLSVVCPECNCYLHDRCFSCGAPVNFHRIELGRRNQIPYFPISTCSDCLASLVNAPVVKAPKSLVDMQKQMYGYIDSGTCESFHVQYSHLFFHALRLVVGFFSSKREALVRLNRVVSKSAKVDFEVPLGGFRNNFDFLELQDRAKILQKAWWLLGDWPTRFRKITAQTETWSSSLIHDCRSDAPFWFWEEVMNNNFVVFSPWKKYLKKYRKHNSYNSIWLAMSKQSSHPRQK
jgi:hypothetical protein